MRPLLLSILLLGLTGCMHLKGVVYEDLPNNAGSRPMKTATLSIGRPTGIAVYGKTRVNDKGEFDFFIGPTDYNQIFLYDGAGDPEMTMRRLDENQLSDHMVLHLRRAGPPNPLMPVDVNINPFDTRK